MMKAQSFFIAKWICQETKNSFGDCSQVTSAFIVGEMPNMNQWEKLGN